MKYRILFLIAATVILASCSSVYKSSQTPDDVYYSPASAMKGVAAARTDSYEDYTSSSEDNYLRMRIQNHYRWNAIDDFDYWNNPGYAYNNYYGGYNGFSPYISVNPYVLNNWYSPYYSGYWSSYSHGWFGSYYPSYGYGYYTPVYVIKNPVRNTSVARPSLSSYNNRNYNDRNYNNINTNTNVQRQTLGSSLRKAFAPNNNNNTYNNNNNRTYNNNNTSTDRPARSYTPSSSSSSSSGSSSSGGSVSRPPRH